MRKQASSRLCSTNEIVILLSCVSIISFSILTFEITLTRIFSVTYSYHYSFFVVSLALFGLGLGGILAQRLFSKASPENVFMILASVSLLFSLSVSFLTILTASFIYPNVFADAAILFIPFFIGGTFLAGAYKVFAVYGSIIYFVDLVGAAAGSLAVLIFLPRYGAVNTVILVGVIASAVSVLLAAASKRKMLVYITTASLLILVFSTQYFRTVQVLEVQVAGDQDKEIYDVLKDPSLAAKIVDSRWSALGRTDLVEFKNYSSMKMIFVDGSAGTAMYRFDGNFNTSGEVYRLKNSTAYYPYYFAKKDKALVIGSGGGVDVLNALMAGVNHVTAVEVNSEAVEIVRDYSAYNGGIYTKYENVHVIIDEGRSFLKRTPERYDVIMLNIPITKTAQGISGYSLAENYLFTTDSVKDYLDHLEDQGYLVIVVHNTVEIYKLAAITLRVLEERGVSISEAVRHIVVTAMHSLHSPVFMVKKSAFTKEESGGMYAKSNELGFTPIFFPYTSSEKLDPILSELAKGSVGLETLISYLLEYYGYDIEPPTDDKPFFYKFEKELPPTLLQLWAVSLALCATMLILYFNARGRHLYLIRRKEPNLLVRRFINRFSLFIPYYFSTLGLGFMLIEVSLIQRFILFLGQPTTAISVLLFSLLLSSGIGGLCSRRWGGESLDLAFWAALIVAILVVLYVPILPLLFNLFLGYEPAIRFLVAVSLLFPLGFFMGIPFPSGIRALGRKFQECIAWMWGLNGAYSLLGSVLAIVTAMSLGFNVTFLFGGLSYFAVFILGRLKLKIEREPAETAVEYEKPKGKVTGRKSELRGRRIKN